MTKKETSDPKLPAGALAAAKVAEESERNGLMVLPGQAGSANSGY